MSVKKTNQYLKYSAIGIQLALTVTILTVGGHYLDQYLQFKFPIFTLVGKVLGISSVFYILLKKL